MTYGSVDWEDFAVFPVYFVLAAVTLGFLSATVPLIGWDLNITLYDSGDGYGLTVASALAIVLLGYVAYTNDWSLNGWGYAQAWVVLTTVILLLTVPMIAAVQDFILVSDLIRLIAFVVLLGGYAVFSWLG